LAAVVCLVALGVVIGVIIAGGSLNREVRAMAVERARAAQPYRIAAAALDVQGKAALSHMENMTTNLKFEGRSGDQVQALPAALWPARVDLRGLLSGEPSLSRLVLGVTVNETGQQETVKGALSELVHIAVGGSSGWGKSVFLQTLAYQMANAVERPQLVAVDLEGVTLNVLAGSDRLLYPLADTEEAASAVLAGVTAEIERRKARFSEAGLGIDSLAAYNARVDEGQRLRPLILLVDEATALLENKRVEGALRTVTLRARKYGVWSILAGQDWKASSLDTAIRNQLSTRVQFKALSPSQSRVLLGTGDAAALQAKGRAYAEIPGRGRLMIQAPYITAAMFAAVARQRGPTRDLPEAPVVEVDNGVNAEHAAEVQDRHARGDSDTRIAREVFGYGNPFYIGKVREILQQQQQ
jgi:hypothetical protein